MKLGGIVALALLYTISAQREAPPPRREEREEAQQGLVACRLAGKTLEECRQDSWQTWLRREHYHYCCCCYCYCYCYRYYYYYYCYYYY